MGRVSKYKKVKSSVNRYGTGFGFNDSYGTPKVKKRSLTAKAHLARKQKRKTRSEHHNNHNNNDDDGGGFNLPPSSRQDDFNLQDLVGSIKREKQVSSQQLLQADTNADAAVVTSTVTMLPSHHHQQQNQPQPHEVITQESKQMVRDLHLKTTKGGKLAPSPSKSLKRQEGESMKAFRKRVKDETRQIMKDTLKQQQQQQRRSTTTVAEDGTTTNLSAKQQKKKEFLNQKKMKKKYKKSSIQNNDDDEDSDEEYYYLQRQKQQHAASGDHDEKEENPTSESSSSFMTGERAVAAVRSGALQDPVERPPVFAQLPRGAKPKQQQLNQKNKKKTHHQGHNRMNDSQIQAEQNAMEKMRLQVQAQYAIMKQKRKRAGDFHL